jgi:manganese transport protein
MKGNWATDIGGGARFGYQLLFVIVLSSVSAMVLQSLCIKLGVVTGRDLAQQCRFAIPRHWNIVLYLLAELAIMATDLAEVIGSAIALKLLFGLPLPWGKLNACSEFFLITSNIVGVVITALDVLIILRWWGTSPKAARWYEVIVMVLILVVAICFVIQLCFTKPDGLGILRGLIPTGEIFRNSEMLFVAIGILGATGEHLKCMRIHVHSHATQSLLALFGVPSETDSCFAANRGNLAHVRIFAISNT